MTEAFGARRSIGTRPPAAVWKLGEETKHFDWTEPCGILTGSI